jgi:hypothetical protein
MDIEEILALIISVISVLIAFSAFLYTWRSNRPHVKGRLNHVLFAPLDAGDAAITSPITAFLVHMTLTNVGRYPVFIEDYKLEVDRGGGYESVNRLTRIRGFPDFSIGRDSIRLKNWREWLIYYPLKAVEFGSPLSGMAVFYSTEPYDKFTANISKYRLTALDVFGKGHRFETAPGDFIDSGRLVEMFETGGAEVLTH